MTTNIKGIVRSSVPFRVKNLKKMRNFWANFTDFEPETHILKCKTETKNLNILMQDCGLYLGKANSMQKICNRVLKVVKFLGKNLTNLSFGQIRPSQNPRGNTGQEQSSEYK